MKNKEKTVIGWSEFVEFADWGIKKLKAKIDTGGKVEFTPCRRY